MMSRAAGSQLKALPAMHAACVGAVHNHGGGRASAAAERSGGTPDMEMEEAGAAEEAAVSAVPEPCSGGHGQYTMGFEDA